METVTVGDQPIDTVYNSGNGFMYMVNAISNTTSVINHDNEGMDTVNVWNFPFSITYNGGNGNLYVVNSGEPGEGTVSVIGTSIPPFEGILGSGNNINFQVQENSGNITGVQSGFGGSYSDSPIFQGPSTEQDSQIVS